MVTLNRRTALGGAAALTLCRPAKAIEPPPGPPPGREQALAGWADLLRTRVDGLGRVDFAAVRRDPAPLDGYVSFIAHTSPDGMAGAERLAYLVNAYNALCMWGIIKRGVPERLDMLDRVSFFKFTRMTVGNRTTSLYDLENDVIRPIGDARVHFALNCMSVSCPRLPRTPFTAGALDGQLRDGAVLFFGEPRNVAVDDASRTLTLSAIMDFYTADFLRHAPSLAAYVNRFRAPPVPTDYQTRFFAYDWTINRQPGT